MLERYGHGGDLVTAEAQFGCDADSFLDFSSNMNPFGPPQLVRHILERYFAAISRYPYPACRNLRRLLAEKHGVPESAILIGNGAAEMIDLAVRTLKPANTALAAPSFTEYGDAIRKAGGSATYVQLAPGRDFRLELQDLRRETGSQAWFLGSPNNPTGQTVDPRIIRELLTQGKFVFLDEAFLDFLPDEPERSFVQTAADSGNMLVIRSLTKFYAIPGIRLGYVVGNPELIAAMKGLQTHWSVNSLALEIGEAVIQDRAYAEKTLAWMQPERIWLAERLAGIGLRVFPSEANYLLVSVPLTYGVTARMLQTALGKRGILIRDASLFAGLDDSYFRVAIKLRADNEKLAIALEQGLAELTAHAAVKGEIER